MKCAGLPVGLALLRHQPTTGDRHEGADGVRQVRGPSAPHRSTPARRRDLARAEMVRAARHSRAIARPSDSRTPNSMGGSVWSGSDGRSDTPQSLAGPGYRVDTRRRVRSDPRILDPLRVVTRAEGELTRSISCSLALVVGGSKRTRALFCWLLETRSLPAPEIAVPANWIDSKALVVVAMVVSVSALSAVSARNQVNLEIAQLSTENGSSDSAVSTRPCARSRRAAAT